MEIKKTTVYSINLNGTCFTLSDQEAKELYNELKILLDVRPAPVPDAQNLATAELAQFETVDPWESVIDEWLSSPYSTNINPTTNSTNINPTTNEILQSCLQIDVGRLDKTHNHKVQIIMKKLGYESKQCGSGANRVSRWFKKQ
jgi:hypothetical protein